MKSLLVLPFVVVIMNTAASAQLLTEEQAEELANRLAAISEAAREEPQKTLPGYYMTYEIDRPASLLSMPNSTATTNTTIEPGTMVEVLDRNGDYFAVEANGELGWLSADTIETGVLEELDVANRLSKVFTMINDLYGYIESTSLTLDGFTIETTPPNVSFAFSIRTGTTP